MDSNDRTTDNIQGSERKDSDYGQPGRVQVGAVHTEDSYKPQAYSEFQDSLATTSMNPRDRPSGYDERQHQAYDIDRSAPADNLRYDRAETRFGVTSHDSAAEQPYVGTYERQQLPGNEEASTLGSEEFRGRASTVYHIDEHGGFESSATTNHPYEYDSSLEESKASGTADNDSTLGKVAEQAGDVLRSERLAEKGRSMREAAGHDQETAEY